jgi:predicted nucleic acid-binding protein
VITAVDSSVLFDIFLADPEFGAASARAMRTVLQQGTAVACAPVLAEVSSLFKDSAHAMAALTELGVRYDTMDADSALAAGTAWRRYRDRGGPRSRVVADFLIGAHARSRADRLFTRDAGFYRDYFRGLALLVPTA